MALINGGRVQRGEGFAAALSFFYFFCVLAAYYVVRPVREQLTAAVGSTQLPWFFLATLIATLLLTPVFGWLVARWPRRVLVPAVYGFFIACLAGFVPFFERAGLLPARMLGMVFFVWVSVFNLFVVSVFWSFMADIYSAEQSRRLFPLIAAGGVLGAIVGPAVTRTLVDVIGIAHLLLVSAGLLALAMGCAIALGRRLQPTAATRLQAQVSAPHEQGIGGSMFDGLRQVFAVPFMRNMAILMLLGDMVGTVAYALVTDYAKASFHDGLARTRFFANLDMTTNLLQLLLQLTVTHWLMRRGGARAVMGVWAALAASACLGPLLSGNGQAHVFPFTQTQVAGWAARVPDVPLLHAVLTQPLELLPVLSWVVLMLLTTRALAYAMLQPARESLYTQVPRSWRFKGKNAVDTAVWRGGDLLSATAVNALHAVAAGVAAVAGLSAAAILLSGWIGLRAAHQAQEASRDADST